MNKFRLYLTRHPKLYKAMYLICLVLLWGLLFPFEFDVWKLYLLIVGFGLSGVGFVSLFGINREKISYITSLILTGLGMIFRYFFEYGEVSNIRDFTTFNIISYIVVVPILSLVSYHYFAKRISKRN